MGVQNSSGRALDGLDALTAGLGGGSIVAGGLVAAIDSAAPIAHGPWLAAYLVLVCGVSQLILGFGQIALRGAHPSRRTRRAQLALWNLGNLAVAGGVLAGSAALVTIGSLMLLVGLARFAAGAGLGRRGARACALAYHAVVVGLAVSVIIGSALAGAAPGGGV
jgi:hypothetical protein